MRFKWDALRKLKVNSHKLKTKTKITTFISRDSNWVNAFSEKNRLICACIYAQ